MLIISRKRNETFRIYTSDGVVTIRVSEIKEGQAKLGIDAPSCVTIMRKEIDDQFFEPIPKQKSFVQKFKAFLNKHDIRFVPGIVNRRRNFAHVQR